MAHYIVAVKPPAEPAPASTLVLLRDRAPGAVEVLLIQRHQASKFAAGDFVFPGGKVEPEDHPADAADWCVGLDPARAVARLGGAAPPRTALGYWIAALREAFEEVGVLLASDADGAPARLDAARVTAYRRGCRADHRAFWAMLRTERLRLATDGLVHFAHWITPEENPLRFDTRFFAAPMPAGQEPLADEHEIVAVRWLTAREALDAFARREISLRLPTQKTLALIADARSTAEALAELGARVITPIRPRVIVEGSARRALLPGDPGYW